MGEPGHAIAFADVVGDLIRLETDAAVIEGRDGLTTVRLDHVAFAREAPPSTADVIALEQICARGWRAAEVEEYDGWLLRADHGFTARANSVLPLRSTRDLDAHLASARAFYRRRGLPLRVQAPLPARRLLEAELGERGWPEDPDVHVMVGRIDLLSAAALERSAAVDVAISTEPPESWWQDFDFRGADDSVVRALVTRHERAGFATVTAGGRLRGRARMVVDDGWLGLSTVWVAPEARGRGLARTMMLAALRWGRDRHAARRAYLQAPSTNSGAVALYEAMGFWTHHDYRYRREPGRSAGPTMTS